MTLLTIAGFLPLIVSSMQSREATACVIAPWRPPRVTNKMPEATIRAASSWIFGGDFKSAAGDESKRKRRRAWQRYAQNCSGVPSAYLFAGFILCFAHTRTVPSELCMICKMGEVRRRKACPLIKKWFLFLEDTGS